MTEYPVLNALLFAGLGLVIYIVALAVAARMTPFDLRKQIVEERNIAVAVVAAAIALGLAWIVAATVH